MKTEWTSLAEVARERRLSLNDVQALALREHWPRVFKRQETLVLPTRTGERG